MKIFEFNFHCPANSRITSGCYRFGPESVHERRVGSLFMVGELGCASSQDKRFLANLSQNIKENHYGSRFKTPEKALNDSLQKANQYLSYLIKQENIGWMEDICYAVAAIKDNDWYFTKTGDISVYILRDGQIMDLDEEINFPAIEPYPLQVFHNLAAGSLDYGDAVMFVTPKTDSLMKGVKLQQKIALILNGADTIDAKNSRGLEELILEYKEVMTQACGTCLVVYFDERNDSVIMRDFEPNEEIKKVSMREMFKIARERSNLQVPRLSWNYRAPRFAFHKPSKKVYLAATAVILAIAGIPLCQKAAQNISGYDKHLQNTGQILSQAQANIKSGDIQKATDILASVDLAALNGLATDTKTQKKVKDEAFRLSTKANQLYDEINDVEYAQAQVIAEFTGYNPQKIAISGNNLYFYDSGSRALIAVAGQSKFNKVETGFEINDIAACSDSVFLYSRSGKIALLKNGKISNQVTLDPMPQDFESGEFNCYQDSLYFLDKRTGKILKYQALSGLAWKKATEWLKDTADEIPNTLSMAVEKNIWSIKPDGSIAKLLSGRLENEFEYRWLPALKSAKLASPLVGNNIYIMDSANSRIAVISKDGIPVKQVKSQQFDGIKDIYPDKGGKFLYILGSNRLLKLELP